MGAWDKYDKQKVNKKSAWADYDKIDVVKPTFTQRMTGTPVKQKDGTFKATTGVTDVLTELPFVGPFARMGKTLGETLAYNKLDDNTRESLAKSGEVDNVVPDLKRKNSEIAFDAGEAILDAVTGGISGLYRKGAVNTLKLSPLKVRNLADLKLTRNQILKRLGIETGVNTGAAYGYEVGQNVKEDKKGIQALKPGVGTPLTAILTAVMGAKGASDLSNKITQNNIVSKYAQKFNVPEVGVPNVKLESPQMRETRVQQEIANRSNLPVNKLPSGETIPLPEKGILDAQRRLNETPKVETPDIIKKPEILRAEKFNSKQDFINNEIGFYTRTKQKIPNNITERSSKIWDEAHTTPKQQPLAPLPKQEIPTQQVGQDIPNTKTILEQPNVKQATPEQSRIETPETRADIEKKIKSLDEDEVTKDFTPQQKKQNIEYFNSIEGNESKVKNIAMGLDDDIPEGVNPNSIWKLLADKADALGDGKLALELSESPLRKKISIEAQNLSMSNIGDNGVGLTKKIEIINKKLKDMVSKNTDIDSQTIKEVDNIKETVAKILKESKVDMKYVDEILEEIRCK